MAAVLALAFGLRCFRLGSQSLWGDEAISVSRASAPLEEGLARLLAAGTHTPLYELLLRGWLPLAGPSEWAVRFLSLIPGVLLVAVLFQLGRLLAGTRAGLLAAGLGATSPLLVYYSQEARMYMLATCFAALSTLLLVRWYDGWGRGALVGHALAGSAALFSHYFAGFVLVALGLWLLVWARPAWRRLRDWLAAQAATALLLAPWLLVAQERLRDVGAAVERGGVPLETVVAQVGLGFSLGWTLEREDLLWRLAPFVAALLLACWRGWERRPALLFLLLVVPVLGGYLVSFVPHRGWVRYFLPALPAYIILLAIGVERAVRWRPAAGALLLCGLVVAQGSGLARQFTDSRYARPDFRAQVAHLQAGLRPNDLVVVNGIEQVPAFTYYYHGPAPLLALPGESGEEAIERELETALAGRRELWLVKYLPPDFDPDDRIERWLHEHAYRVERTLVQNVRFLRFVPIGPGMAAGGPRFTPLGASLGDGISLLGYSLERSERAEGTRLGVVLYWQATAQPRARYKVLLQLLDGQGVVVAQRDAEPLGGLRPTASWRPGLALADPYLLPPLEARAEGEHSLRVSLYDPVTGDRLPADGQGEGLLLGRVDLGTPTASGHRPADPGGVR